MDDHDLIRRRAGALRALACGEEQLSGLELARRAAQCRGVELAPLDAEDPLLSGGEAMLDHGLRTIFYKRSEPAEEAALIAHELGHLVLHDDETGESNAPCSAAEVDVGAGEDGHGAAHRVEAYSARERREQQANLFARELLLPRPLARRLFAAGKAGSEISDDCGLPHDLVRRQLIDALLLPPSEESEAAEHDPSSATTPIEDPLDGLDASQRAAAVHRGSPLLLEAGPGSGKTRTLVARIAHLLQEGAEPESILALTFSNKAAGEIVERVAAAAPQAAPRIWSGTFHAFGLELVRRHHQRLGFEPEVRIFDRSDAIELLEDRLPTLGLRHHQNLYDPALELREILSAISRAKDELVDPQRYRELAEKMLEAADDEKARIAAERALEVAHVYAVYEDALRDKQAVDFGDLIRLPEQLLREHEGVRDAVRGRRRHVLVDEYQDVNRASAQFLRALVGDGERLWVVGDARQSIYRFRGASTANVDGFEDDFPGATRRALSVNYRSAAEVVEAFSDFAEEMRVRGLGSRLKAHRGPTGIAPRATAVPDAQAEIAAVASAIRELEATGVRLRDQAVLCRSNATLSAFAEGLEARGLPVLHLGSIFEREEVRDLLALLSLIVDPTGSGLLRVATIAAYSVPMTDVVRFLRVAREREIRVLDGLTRLAEIDGLSAAGRAGLGRLARDLEDARKASTPWRLLSDYLFERGEYLRAELDVDSLDARLRRVAIYQLLSFVRGPQPGGKGFPIRRLLHRVRRLVLLAEERDLRRIPAPAGRLDAVRLLTLHGAKGLEFEAVHLPSMATGSIPASYRPPRCPPPAGMLPDDDVRGGQVDEEECLFFVALSRARTHLRLYRPTSRGGRKRNPSPFLERLPLAESVLASVEDPFAPPPRDERVRIVGRLPPPGHDDLALYERCPRRFFYSRAADLAGWGRDGGFVKAQRAIYTVLDGLGDLPPGAAIEIDKLHARLAEVWEKQGPKGHAFESEYRILAERVLSHLYELHGSFPAIERPALELPLESGRIVLRPDLAATLPDGRVLLRLLRTGRRGSFKGDDTIHGLFQEAAERRYGAEGYQIDVLHLADGGETPVGMTQRKLTTRLGKGAAFLKAIEEGRFPPNPDAVSCPRCPYFFVCPAIPEGELTL